MGMMVLCKLAASAGGAGRGLVIAPAVLIGTAALLAVAAAAVFVAIAVFRRGPRRKTVGTGSAVSAGAPRIWAAAAQNQGARPEQEDSFYISDTENAGLVSGRGALAVVADGMGGLSGGAEISRTVCEVFGQLFPFAPAEMDPPRTLLYLLEKANAAVNDLLAGKAAQSGSTAVAALVQNGLLWTLSVGDSGLALLRNGSLVRLNREHTYAVELDDDACRGRLEAADAVRDPQRRALTSYIGMGELRYIDRCTAPVALVPGDWLLLMSDGVTNALSDAEIAAAVYGGPAESAGRLESLVLEKRDPEQDNFTVLLLKYE